MDRVEKRKTTTILIVDDSELNRVMLAAMLGENYEIRSTFCHSKI